MDNEKVKETQELISLFNKAKKIFLEEEKDIIDNNINERTLSARLMYHLECLLREDEKYKKIHADCEYNRNIKNIKTLHIYNYDKGKDEHGYNKGTKIYPDIIIHERGKENNLIVIEMKKIKSDEDKKECDKKRLAEMTDSKREFKYKLGVYFEVDGKNDTVFYVDSKIYKM